MVEAVRLGDGRFGGFRVAEIVSIPSAELIDGSAHLWMLFEQAIAGIESRGYV